MDSATLPVSLSIGGPLREARFLERPNRFVVRARLGNGRVAVAHLADPGRLKELLVPGRRVWLRHTPAPQRTTEWSAALVESPDSSGLVSVDTQLPNRLVGLSTWLFATMYANTQVPATVGRFLDGNFEELQESPHLFFPMTRFTYGLSYSIFGSEAMGYTVDDTTAPGRYAAFTDGCAMFFGPRLQAQAQEFWKVEPLDPEKRQALYSDVPTLILNGELDHVIPPRYVEAAAGRLTSGHLYLFAGVAHSPVDHGDCALGMLLQFFDDPSKAPDGSCVEQFTHELKTESAAG